MSRPGDNAHVLAAAALNKVHDDLLSALERGRCRIVIELEPAGSDRRRLIVTTGAPEAFTVPTTDLGAELLRRHGTAPAAPRPQPAGAGRSAPADRRADHANPPDDPPSTPTSPRPVAVPERRYLDSAQVALRYGVTPDVIRQWRRHVKLPPALVLGKRLLWDEADLNRWDDQHKA